MTSRPNNAPIEARGRLTMIRSALRKERKEITTMAKEMTMAMIMAMPMSRKVLFISSYTPPWLAVTSYSNSKALISFCASLVTAPTSFSVTVAVTVEDRTPSIRWMLMGSLTKVTLSATSANLMGVAIPPLIRRPPNSSGVVAVCATPLTYRPVPSTDAPDQPELPSDIAVSSLLEDALVFKRVQTLFLIVHGDLTLR